MQEEEMAEMISNWLCSLLRRVSISMVLGGLLVPSLACAESVNLLRSAEAGSPEQIVAKRVAGRPLVVGLDENGDVTIYFRKVSLTVSYNPADVLPQARERVPLNPLPESAAVGGFGVKVAFAF
jgi:hypothetical protein